MTKLYIIIILITCIRTYGQPSTLENYYNAIIELDFASANEIGNTLDKGAALPYFSYISQLTHNAGQKPYEDLQILTTLNTINKNTEIHQLSIGVYYLYNQPSSQVAFEKLRSIIANSSDNIILKKLAYLYLFDLYNKEIVQSSDEYYNFLQNFDAISNNVYEKTWFQINLIRYYSKSSKKNSLETFYQKYVDFENFIQPVKTKLNEKILAYYYFYVGLYNKLQHNHIKSKSAYIETIEIAKNKPYLRYLAFGSNIHLCEIESKNGNTKLAKKYLDDSRCFWNKSDSTRSRFVFNRFSAINYFEKVNDTFTAYRLLKNSILDEVKLDFRNNTLKISETNIKLETAEKEKQILIEQEQKKRFRNGVIALGSILLLGSFIFYLIQKNTKRKQLLAIQEKELESQKVTNLLKEQELTAIDAMIEGQEKERQRIANDLHDDLGGLMVTVKLHFNALKEKQSPELYEKTNQLLDKAYDKVRSVAHAKNSGVMAKKGLLKAIDDMARTVSQSNQLHIDVIDHGLDERLENSLELTIFRIIQELITNVIKHAEATEATIHMTKHDDSLNIMVEDNGKGFNTKNIQKNSGMGIHSIDKRIENLGGKVTLESEMNKGTTIIIDLPFLDAH